MTDEVFAVHRTVKKTDDCGLPIPITTIIEVPMNKPVTYTPQSGEPEKKRDPVARFWLSLLRAALVIGLILYILLHLTGGLSETMKTVQANLYTRELTLPLTGTVVRDETAIPSAATGAVSYFYVDGARVRLGAKVATVYSGYTDSTAVGSVAQTDRLIDLLTAAEAEGTTVESAVRADAAIRQSLLTLASATRRGHFADATHETESLLLSMLRRDAILGGSGDASALLASLKSSRAAMTAASLGSGTDIYAPEAGYFYGGADDGCETRFSYADIERMTPAAYRAAAAETPTAGSAVARIVRRAKWYFAAPAAKEDALGFTVGSSYALDFAASNVRIPMTLAAKNEENGEVLLVFVTQEMPADFDFARTQRVSAVYGEVTGYRVPSSALRVVEGHVGVYVRAGSTIRFRTADVLDESGAYVWISPESAPVTLYAQDDDPDNDLVCKGLTLYDEVIVSGARDLTPNKHIN